MATPHNENFESNSAPISGEWLERILLHVYDDKVELHAAKGLMNKNRMCNTSDV